MSSSSLSSKHTWPKRFRTFLGNGTKEPSATSEIVLFEYKPLDNDSIRIVYLQPRREKKHADEIECTLTHVAFGSKPEYKALSYAWGDGTIKRTILLNGIRFEVGENLAAALVNIRGLESAGEGPQAIWIDAISINQSDIGERNRQVRLMPFIYARAQMVLVWLGTDLSFKEHCSFENSIRSQKLPKHPKSPVASANFRASGGNYTVLSLYKRDYWKRLWIIQEIGKAKYGGLKIHYNSNAIDWDVYIETMKAQPNLAKTAPLQLDGQRRGRFEGGHTLVNLLRTNQYALCKDPRDKVYGFIGLAVDVHDRFPMDYSKSLFEVFADTIFYLNSDESRSQHDILDMSRLVGRMIGGKSGLEPDNAATDFDVGDITVRSRLTSLRVPGYLVGRIKEIGPLHSDMIARTETLEDWTSLIWRNVPESQTRSTVLEQSELFLEMLQQFDEVTQRTIFSFDTAITWQEQQQYSMETFETQLGSKVDENLPAYGSIQYVDLERPGPRLFLLQPRPSDIAPSRVGLAPLGTQVGDFVIHVAGIERAVIVRQFPNSSPSMGGGRHNHKYQIIGCAGLARDTITAREVRGTKVISRELFTSGMFAPPSEAEHFNMYMDIRTAWEVSSIY